MNSYTSISNKLAIRLFFIINFFLLILTILLMFKLDDYMAQKGYFILHKISKAAHMREYTKQHQNDIIFIGYSKVQNHISTAIFEEENLSIYTYGIPAISFSDYPYMINKAIKTNPKKIVLNIHPTMLYGGWKLPRMQQPTFIDMLEQIKATYLPAFPKNILDIFPLKFYFDRYKLLFSHTSIKVKKEIENLILTYKYNPDCKIFNYLGKKRILTVCTNGNGTVWYNKPTKKQNIIKLTKINKAALDLLNYLLDEIKNHKIEVYILLETINYHTTYDFNIDEFYKNIHIEKNNIIDITHLKFKDEQWADNGHLNGKGKEKISSFIINKLK